MNEVPFWARSPSPFTFVFWILLALWGNLHIRGKIQYKRFQRVMSVIDSIFVVGLIALSYDSLWIVFQAIRFRHFFPGDVLELIIRLIQNLGLFAICIFNAYPLFKKKILKLSKVTKFFIFLELAYFVFWFSFAPSMAFTDWTYAIRMGFEPIIVIGAFNISHVLGKLIQGLIFISLFQKPSKLQA